MPLHSTNPRGRASPTDCTIPVVPALSMPPVLRLLILSVHCSLQSQIAELQQQALLLLKLRRWSKHTLLAPKKRLHQKALRVRQRPRRRPPPPRPAGTGRSTFCPVRHMLTAFHKAANSAPISSAVLVIGGFTPASASRCQKRQRRLRCQGHCEAQRNLTTRANTI